MTVERVSIVKDISKRGSVYAPISNINDVQGGSITVGRVIKQDKTANFANADSKRVVLNVGNGQETFPRKENNKVVYETLTMPIPVYLEATYKLTVKTEYQQQMNELRKKMDTGSKSSLNPTIQSKTTAPPLERTNEVTRQKYRSESSDI